VYDSGNGLNGSFLAECRDVSTDITWSHLDNLSHIYFGTHTHFLCKNLEYFNSGFFIWDSKRNLFFESAGTAEALVYALWSCGGSNDYDVNILSIQFI